MHGIGVGARCDAATRVLAHARPALVYAAGVFSRHRAMVILPLALSAARRNPRAGKAGQDFELGGTSDHGLGIFPWQQNEPRGRVGLGASAREAAQSRR